MAHPPRPERFEGESDDSYAPRLMEWHRRKADARRARKLEAAPKISEPQPEGPAASDFASKPSIEAARLRDIAARRREPRIENISEPEG
jgi:hypothetical protein